MTRVNVYGVPSAAGCREETSEVIDSAQAPARIRSMHRFLIDGFDVPGDFTDCGDVGATNDISILLAATEEVAVRDIKCGMIPLFLGGAHTLTLGALRGVRKALGDFSLIYVDAHPDLMPRNEINYGSTLYHAVREGAVTPHRLGIVGARMIERAEREVIAREKIRVVSCLEVERNGISVITEELLQQLPPPYYLSIDLDAIDPAIAPGVTTPSPIGLTPREVLTLTDCVLRHPTVAVDIVELAPSADDGERTARIAATLLREIVERCGS